MEKVKSFLKNMNKKTIIIAASCLAVLIIGGSLFLVFGKGSEEDLLLEDLKKMGISFYEDLYYDQVGKTDDERSEFLAKYKDLGIKISLSNLTRFNAEENKESLDKLTEKCNVEETKVVVYPKEPYAKNSYEVELITDCNFEE